MIMLTDTRKPLAPTRDLTGFWFPTAITMAARTVDYCFCWRTPSIYDDVSSSHFKSNAVAADTQCLAVGNSLDKFAQAN